MVVLKFCLGTKIGEIVAAPISWVAVREMLGKARQKETYASRWRRLSYWIAQYLPNVTLRKRKLATVIQAIRMARLTQRFRGLERVYHEWNWTQQLLEYLVEKYNSFGCADCILLLMLGCLNLQGFRR